MNKASFYTAELTKLTMRAFLLLTIVAVAFASQECGENSHFESCGTACPLTCENHENPPKFCVLRCDIGCHCDKGYVKTSDGRCVEPEQCPSTDAFAEQQCGENSHFESCGTACPLTCENYENPPQICVARCDIGCHCNKGYVKTSDGRCVRPEQCPSTDAFDEQQCGKNAHFTTCGSACPLTCEFQQPRVCVKRCDVGCHCDEGYVKNANGECVRPDQCPSSAKPITKTCNEKPDGGMCLAYFPMWYYNPETQTCEKFIYGGCQGNGNRYGTEEECMQNCRGNAAPTACLEEKVVGPCKAAFRRYFHNKETGKCEEFVYGGCGGNSNNFLSQEDCEGVCKASKAAPTACLEEKVVGPCKADFPRFFHDKATGQCKPFTYGGCGGNSNNFLSREDCEAVCTA